MANGPAQPTDTGARPHRARLVSTYYDTPDHTLVRRGSTLRVRRRGRKFIQTVKAVAAPGESHIGRGEWEDTVATNRPDPQAAQTGRFLSPDITEQLQPVFRTEVSRLTIPLSPQPDTRIEAAIDRGRIRNGSEAAPEAISEVELELKSGAPTALYDVALKLLHVAPLRLDRHSKAERGYRLAAHAPRDTKAFHADPIPFDAGAPAADVLRRVGHACLDHMLRNEDAALAGDGEGVHQMRVAVRRWRAILSAFGPLFPAKQRRGASSRLKWLGDALGDARNLDVFTGGLLRMARTALPIASEFERLAVAAERRRRTAHAAAAAAISSTRYTETLLALLRWLDGDDWRSEDAAALRQPIDTVAPVLLDRCMAKTRKRARNFAAQSAKKRHKLRIALKKLRYAAELFAGLYEAAAAKQFIQRLKRLQDDLGDVNDVRVARDIVDGLSAPGRRSTGVAHAGRRMIGWHKHRLAENEPHLRRHLNELLTAETFWQPATTAEG